MRRALLVAALLIAIPIGVPDGATGQQLGRCRITSVDTSVFSDRNLDGLVSYYGHVLMFTKGCGTSPAQVEGTFQPVAGAPTACDFRGTLHIDEAVCTGAIGAAAVGTPLTVSASGRTEGTGGAHNFRSSCTLIVPSTGRASCALPVG